MNIETLFSLTPLVVATIPITIGLVQVAKRIGLKSEFAPLLSILFGFGLVAIAGASWQQIIAQGILVGLCASGLFDFSTKTVSV